MGRKQAPRPRLHLSALTAEGVPFGDIGIMLGERVREDMPL